MFEEKSVCEIFNTMNSSNKLPCKIQTKELSNTNEEQDLYEGHLFTKDFKNKIEKMDSSSWITILHRILDLLESKKELLINALTETVCSMNEATKIVKNLHNDFKSYIEAADICEFHANEQEIVNINITDQDIYILGRILAPLLITGCFMKILVAGKYLIPYLVAIGNIITSAGIPKGSKYTFVTEFNEPEYATRFFISGKTNEQYCPMIIFEESDLDSAIDNLIDSSRSFNGMLYWSLTHVYIQESIFNDVISKIKDISKRLTNLELITCDLRNQLMESKFSKDTCVLFIGWDPKELEIDCSLPMSVCLLPFRTTDEVVTLVNTKCCGCSASIWTDKLSTANLLSSLINIDTVWINSHGDVNPLVPFESSNETRLPLNGIQLFEYLFTLRMLYCREISKFTCVSGHETDFRESFEEAIKVSTKGHEILNKLHITNLMRILDSICPQKVHHKMYFLNVNNKYNSLFHSTNMNILCYSKSCKIVMILMLSNDISRDKFLMFLYNLIAARNSIIIYAPPYFLNYIANFLPRSLLKEMINLVDIKYYKSNNSSITNKIGKVYYITNIIDNGNKCEDCSHKYLPSLFLTKKAVWFPSS